MAIEPRGDAQVVTHALAKDVLTRLRDVETAPPAFREGLTRLGRVCGYELLDAVFGTEPVAVRTPLAETTGDRIRGRDDVVIVSVLRAAVPFVEGLLEAFPGARQGVVSAGRDEAAGMDTEGRFPVATEYVNVPAIADGDTVVVADPMLATGSTMCAVLETVLADASPARTIVLSAVAAPEGVARVSESYPDVDCLTVGLDDRLDDEGYIVPGLGDAGDRAFRTG
jgi:uracil phosphoribosyltransferase